MISVPLGAVRSATFARKTVSVPIVPGQTLYTANGLSLPVNRRILLDSAGFAFRKNAAQAGSCDFHDLRLEINRPTLGTYHYLGTMPAVQTFVGGTVKEATSFVCNPWLILDTGLSVEDVMNLTAVFVLEASLVDGGLDPDATFTAHWYDLGPSGEDFRGLSIGL